MHELAHRTHRMEIGEHLPTSPSENTINWDYINLGTKKAAKIIPLAPMHVVSSPMCVGLVIRSLLPNKLLIDKKLTAFLSFHIILCGTVGPE